jgi:hypothetical protein
MSVRLSLRRSCRFYHLTPLPTHTHARARSHSCACTLTLTHTLTLAHTLTHPNNLTNQTNKQTNKQTRSLVHSSEQRSHSEQTLHVLSADRGGHATHTTALAFSHDATLLATGAADGTLYGSCARKLFDTCHTCFALIDLQHDILTYLLAPAASSQYPSHTCLLPLHPDKSLSYFPLAQCPSKWPQHPCCALHGEIFRFP